MCDREGRLICGSLQSSRSELQENGSAHTKRADTRMRLAVTVVVVVVVVAYLQCADGYKWVESSEDRGECEVVGG